MTARAQKMPAARQVLDKAMAGVSEGEASLLRDIRAVGLPEPVQEYAYSRTRRWRFDFAWPYETVPIAAEVEGGTWANGRHSRGKGYEADLEKYNTATLLGWRVFRFTTEMVTDGRAVAVLERALR